MANRQPDRRSIWREPQVVAAIILAVGAIAAATVGAVLTDGFGVIGDGDQTPTPTATATPVIPPTPTATVEPTTATPSAAVPPPQTQSRPPAPIATATSTVVPDTPTPVTLAPTPSPTPVPPTAVTQVPPTAIPTPLPKDTPTAIEVAPLVGRIVFSAEYEGSSDIYVADADGSQLTNLTENEARDDNPVWSPDGSRIAFHSRRDGNGEIYLMNADGTGLTNLTNTSAGEDTPHWLANGSQIVFRSGNGIYIINDNGSERTLVVQSRNHMSGFSVSPDGTKVAFSAGSSGADEDELSIINIDGSDRTILGKVRKFYPSVKMFSWSPDSLRIAAVARFDERDELYTTSLDGSDIRLITQNSSTEYSPVWSPDGQRIYYYDNRYYTSTIFVADPNISDSTIGEISTNIGGYNFDISPDGNWIMLSAYYHSNSIKSVFLVSTQGSAPMEIVEDLSFWDNYVDWHFEQR